MVKAAASKVWKKYFNTPYVFVVYLTKLSVVQAIQHTIQQYGRTVLHVLALSMFS
jgi:hypothetical protein